MSPMKDLTARTCANLQSLMGQSRMFATTDSCLMPGRSASVPKTAAP